MYTKQHYSFFNFLCSTLIIYVYTTNDVIPYTMNIIVDAAALQNLPRKRKRIKAPSSDKIQLPLKIDLKVKQKNKPVYKNLILRDVVLEDVDAIAELVNCEFRAVVDGSDYNNLFSRWFLRASTNFAIRQRINRRAYCESLYYSKSENHKSNDSDKSFVSIKSDHNLICIEDPDVNEILGLAELSWQPLRKDRVPPIYLPPHFLKYQAKNVIKTSYTDDRGERLASLFDVCEAPLYESQCFEEVFKIFDYGGYPLCAYISNVLIAEHVRNFGLGSLIMLALEQRACYSWNVNNVYLHAECNSIASQMYLNRGYEVQNLYIDQDGEEITALAYMQKQIMCDARL